MLSSSSSEESLADYSSEEIAAYDEAVDATERSLRIGREVYADGLATPAAFRALESVYSGDELDYQWESLRDMDAEGGHLDGSSTVVWTKPARILVSDQAGTVDLRACVDSSDVRVFEQGEVIGRPTDKRAVFEITVDLDTDGVWRVADGEETGSC